MNININLISKYFIINKFLIFFTNINYAFCYKVLIETSILNAFIPYMQFTIMLNMFKIYKCNNLHISVFHHIAINNSYNSYNYIF